ncbi:hypothetical protein PHPALM_31268 [Phytophthora palmivora]|uniref:MULE transposase domain-containing protein n=1 Tax=Phytophthora palmivora TaxID=4796 RepID=A0A2P4X316_9STRA|nr:hypothetical protein PHPALM_31268 [Phytophthora palmivora]
MVLVMSTSSVVYPSLKCFAVCIKLGAATSFRYVTVNRENLSKPTRLIGWAYPSLINLLRYHGTTIFVDGTFRCVPPDYKQCVIVMVHDRASGIFVPVYYVLSTSCSGDSLWDMIHFVMKGTDGQLEPAEVVCDFECCSDAISIGCLFHLNQALRDTMKRFQFSQKECSKAMTHGVLDMLTVLEYSLIERGIKWMKREIRQRCDGVGMEYLKAMWRGFWGYFQRTWPDDTRRFHRPRHMEQYDVSVWNMSGLNIELVARTNNPLERFNRVLNSCFPKPRPSMATFVSVIKTFSAEYVQRLTDVPRGRSRRPPRERIQLPVPVDLPDDIVDDSDNEAAVVLEL